MNGTPEPLAEETWVVTEGAAGMENQCLGLAERLPLPVRTLRIKLRKPWRWLAPYSLRSPLASLDEGNDTIAPPWPRLLIACGRQSIPISRAVKQASGGRTITVQCQDPRIGPRHFDLLIPTEHDGITGANVFPIVGSPNRITPERLADARAQFAFMFERLRAPRVAVLVGGASRTHGTLDTRSAERLGAMLAPLAASHGLMVSTSRRTPPQSTVALRRHLADTGALLWDGSGTNPYLGMLAWADAFVVTADSVNMICEAATTGKPVHIFSLSGGRRRAQLFQQSFAARGITRTFEGRIEQWDYPPLDETGRASERIAALL
jgi:mitochondrial fission protein ELM1